MDSVVWLVFCVLLTVLELSTANLICVWFIAGGIAGLIFSLFIDSLWIELLVFAIVSALALYVTKPLVEKIQKKDPPPTNADMLIGKICYITSPVSKDRKGRAKVDGVSWMASSDESLKAGDRAVIVAVSGATLSVRSTGEKI